MNTNAILDTSSYGRGLKAIAFGFAPLHSKDDHKKIELETPKYDALYAFFQQQGGQRTAS